MIAFLGRNAVSLVAVIVLTGLVVGGGGYIVRSMMPVTSVATQGVQFTFDGAAKGQYPNGMLFSPQDVLAGPVLATVYGNSGIGSYMKPEEFASRVFIYQGGEELAVLQTEFDAKLSNTKLTQAERDKVGEEYSARRKAIATNVYTLSLNASGTSAPTAVLDQTMAAIPAAWAEFAQKTRGVLKFDMPMASGQSLVIDDSADFLVQADLLRNTSTRLHESAMALASMAGGNLMRDASGGTIPDLIDEVIANYRVRVLPNYISFVQLAYSIKPTAVIEMLNNRISTQQRDVDSIQARAEQMTQAFQQYVMLNSGASAVMQSGLVAGSGSGSATGTVGSYTLGPGGSMPAIMNLSEGFFDKVIAQGVAARDIEYRQKLNDAQMEAKEAVLIGRLSLDFDKWVLEQLMGTTGESKRAGQTDQSGKSSVVVAVLDPAAIRTEATVTALSLRKFAERLQALYDMLSVRNLNPSSNLYRLDGPAMASVLNPLSMLKLAGITVAAQAVAFAFAVLVLVGRARGRGQGRYQAAGV